MNQTLKTKIETMKPFATLGRYHGKAVIIISVSEYWGEALVRYAHPEAKHPKGRFQISLNLLKEF
ncbi:uncharacterized protein METZ01_LOCUS110026 [marine metagenome]|jgi:hypothetical protein|uniref:Uncharacterized protein n=1 Tax=marine metagenome TaxID=408172 RepID=A0A381WXU3_9ZZZZ